MNQSRLVVVTDKRWASDLITNRGVLPDGKSVQADQTPGAAVVWPGNTELFVNSVNWLGGMEDLIARSARTQDVPRIQLASKASRNSLQWTMLAGMPLAVLICGLTVWFVRRRQ